MRSIIVFWLREVLWSKWFSASTQLKEYFNLPSKDFLRKYELALHIQNWKDPRDMAVYFLNSFSLEVTDNHIEYVVDTILLWIQTWDLFEGIIPLLEDLLENFTLWLISNTTIFESQILKKWNIDHFFQHTLFPWNTWFLKPDIQIFTRACELFGALGSDCYYVDNEIRSIEVAKKLWFETIIFEWSQRLKKKLFT